jgi:hypothetical protein
MFIFQQANNAEQIFKKSILRRSAADKVQFSMLGIFNFGNEI